MPRLRTLALWASLLALPFATLAAVDVAHGPSTHEAAAHCTRACHDHGCAHLAQRIDVTRPPVRLARQLYVANLHALKAPSFGYRDTNLLVYVVGFPVLFAGLLLALLLRRPPGAVAWGPVGLLGGLLGYVLVHVEALGAWGSGRSGLYWACTDFCIHLGNRTGLTYEGFNFLLFVVGFPLTLFALVCGLAIRSSSRS